MRTFTTRKAFNHIHNAARAIMNMRSFGACLIAMMVPCVSSAQIYPGTLCVESGNAATVLRYGTSFVFHTSATTKPLLCPVVRHTGGDVEAWSLTVDRNGATANWTAFLVSANASGNTGNVSAITIPPGNGGSVLNGPGVASFSVQGQLFISVPQQPANARLHGYLVSE